MRSVEGKPRQGAGFATAAVLGLVAVIALLSTGALHDALFGNQLAASRLLHQRAAMLAELGLHRGLGQLATMSPPQDASFTFEPLADETDNVTVELRYQGSSGVAPGFSGGRFTAHHFEIQSSAHVARGVRATRVQGARRVLPATLPAARQTRP